MRVPENSECDVSIMEEIDATMREVYPYVDQYRRLKKVVNAEEQLAQQNDICTYSPACSRSAYLHAHIHVYVYLRACMRTHACMCVYVCVYVHLCECKCILYECPNILS